MGDLPADSADLTGAELHRLVGLAYVPSVKAINAAMDELDMTTTARKPIQGEASNKVLAYRVAAAVVETLHENAELRSTRTAVPGPDQVVVDREDVEIVLKGGCANHDVANRYYQAADRLRAALSPDPSTQQETL